MKCKPWEIWLATVKFEESNASKPRPVIIIDTSYIYAICLKMTSKKRYGEYVLLDWAKSGLKKETTVRQTKLLQLTERDLKSKIGDISIRDRANIIRLIQK